MTSPLISLLKLFGAGRAAVTQSTAPVAQAAWWNLFLEQKEKEEEEQAELLQREEEGTTSIADAVDGLGRRRNSDGHRHAAPGVDSEEMVSMRRDFTREGQTGRGLLRSSSAWRTTAASPGSHPSRHDAVYNHSNAPPTRVDASVYLAQ